MTNAEIKTAGFRIIRRAITEVINDMNGCEEIDNVIIGRAIKACDWCVANGYKEDLALFLNNEMNSQCAGLSQHEVVSSIFHA